MLADAQFWRERKRAFRKTDKEEEYRTLRGRWVSITDNYGLPGSELALRRFKILAEAAARGLPNPQGAELWKLWLAELIRRKINYHERPHTIQCSREYLNNPDDPLRRLGEPLPVVKGRKKKGTTMMVFEGKIATIDRPFEASAILCELLESRAEHPSEGARKAKRPVKQNETYQRIDKALRACAAARPKNHEEVLRLLDERKVPIPNSEPFKTVGGWLKGFQKNRHAASAWLSRAWGKLDLPPFARGPKK